MPCDVRHFVPGATWFFTVMLQDRSSYLLVREIQRLRRVYAEVQHQHPFDTVAICVLPDHLHALWQLPPEDGDFSARWSAIKSGFSQGLPAAWQPDDWAHEIRDDNDFARHVAYIHFNPVTHGLAREVRDWPFSSFHRLVKRGQLPLKWGLMRAARRDGDFGERKGPTPAPVPESCA